jgi:hypothetical protein
MNFNDHAPAHFHVRHGSERAQIRVDNLSVKGYLSPQNLRRVLLWASLHRDELREAWNHRERGENPGRIPPLE